jgi:hypothetical protein
MPEPGLRAWTLLRHKTEQWKKSAAGESKPTPSLSEAVDAENPANPPQGSASHHVHLSIEFGDIEKLG